MNIYGIGTDIVNINRIKNLLSKKNSSFKKRIFTNFEISICNKRKNKIECFAKRFAAKEALFKAVSQENKLKFNVNGSGKVVWQSPKPGSLVLKGSKISMGLN